MRLIDGNALKDQIKKAAEQSTRGDEYNRGLLEAQRLTINAPTIAEWKQIDVESVIDQLWEDIESTGTTYLVDGDTITTDVGYADEGIEFFVKHLKERLKAANENDTVGKWLWKEYDPDYNCGDVVCSKCSVVIFEGVPNDRLKFLTWDYCPNCGQRKKKDSR